MSRTKLERRAIAAAWRVIECTGEEQYRALRRLSRIAGEVAMLDVWLSTKPDPVIVDKVISGMLLAHTPLRNMTPVKREVNWADTVGYRPSLEVM